MPGRRRHVVPRLWQCERNESAYLGVRQRCALCFIFGTRGFSGVAQMTLRLPFLPRSPRSWLTEEPLTDKRWERDGRHPPAGCTRGLTHSRCRQGWRAHRCECGETTSDKVTALFWGRRYAFRLPVTTLFEPETAAHQTFYSPFHFLNFPSRSVELWLKICFRILPTLFFFLVLFFKQLCSAKSATSSRYIFLMVLVKGHGCQLMLLKMILTDSDGMWVWKAILLWWVISFLGWQYRKNLHDH